MKDAFNMGTVSTMIPCTCMSGVACQYHRSLGTMPTGTAFGARRPMTIEANRRDAVNVLAKQILVAMWYCPDPQVWRMSIEDRIKLSIADAQKMVNALNEEI